MLRVAVADLPTDDCDTPTRMEWLNPAHVESAVGYVTWRQLEAVLWLELTLSSGVVRHVQVGPAPTDDIESATEEAISRLFAV